MIKLRKALWYMLSCAIFAIILIRILFLHSFYIGSEAMSPTLLKGENLFVSKIAYGYSRYSLPLGKDINYFSGRIWRAEPKLGDVVAFYSITELNVSFIKRIVGLPGDRIQMKEGILYINDIPCPIEPDGEFQTVKDDGTILKAAQYLETFPNGLKHLMIKQVPFGEGKYDNTPLFTVPAGHYFMMGDNRDESNDSRAQALIGYIPFENLIGRASFISSSPERHIHFWEFWKFQGIY